MAELLNAAAEGMLCRERVWMRALVAGWFLRALLRAARVCRLWLLGGCTCERTVCLLRLF